MPNRQCLPAIHKHGVRRMRVTLIYPAVGRKPGHPYVRSWQMEPLSMALLASLTPPEVELRFYDDRIEDIPFDEPTDLVAITVETFTALRAYRIAQQFRARGVRVVLGGYHVTLIPEEAAEQADVIVVGDAEPVWQQVLDDARQGRLTARYDGSASHPLAGLRPRRDVFRGKNYQRVALVESTRGCSYHCDFCSITAFHKARQNRRPPREVAAEMESERLPLVLHRRRQLLRPSPVGRGTLPGTDAAARPLGRARWTCSQHETIDSWTAWWRAGAEVCWLASSRSIHRTSS